MNRRDTEIAESSFSLSLSGARVPAAAARGTLSLCVLCSSAVLMFFASTAHAADKETTFERVMRTGVLRCGYWNWRPHYWLDINSGEPAGIFYDIMQEFERISGLKVEWNHEVIYSNLIPDLETGKVDAVCAGVWPSAGRGKRVAFTDPLFFSRIDAFARIDDDRFDEDMSKINHPEVRIVVEEGDVVEEIAVTDFPEAQRIAKPQVSGTEYYFLSLTGNKADIVLLNSSYAVDFMKERPGTIRKIPLPRPLRIFGNVLGVNIHEQELQDAVNAAANQVLYSGAVGRILDKYEDDYPEVFLRVADPYK